MRYMYIADVCKIIPMHTCFLILDTCGCLYDKFLQTKYIPNVVVSANKVLPLWMNKFVKTKIKLKNKAWIKYKRSRLSSDHSIYV